MPETGNHPATAASAATSPTLLAAGAGLAAAMGGVFFAFSTFVMPALRRLPPDQGAAAMQAINRAAPTPWFMVPLFGTAALAVGIGARARRDLGDPAARAELAGSVAYLAAIALTVAYHVPRNDALDRLDGSDAAAAWPDWARSWTLANHARTATCLVAAGAWLLGRRRRTHP